MNYRNFTFFQNNSGGYYIGPPSFTVTASDEDAAIKLLESQSWYTDDCCSCCGPRWKFMMSDSRLIELDDSPTYFVGDNNVPIS